MAPNRRVVTKRAKGLDQSLPPLAKIEDVFARIAEKALALGLGEFLDELAGRPITIATMCSGTESPIHALRLIQQALEVSGHKLNFRQLFSAEIESWKQAFIDRNFREIPVLYRDITEFKGPKAPTTAYGTPCKLPSMGEAMILVAGFACVDFSSLNSKVKELEEAEKMAERLVANKKDPGQMMRTLASRKQREEGTRQPGGESGRTFFAILDYADDYRPPIVILENVRTAPWERIKLYWKQIGYEAVAVDVDSKEYYIPQTRQRTYLICFNSRQIDHSPGLPGISESDAEAMKRMIQTYMSDFKRQASSSVEDFLDHLPAAMLQRAKEDTERSYLAQSRRDYDWSRCEYRYSRYREDKRLGNERPLTRWKEDGRDQFPDHGRTATMSAQVNRIKDTQDVGLLDFALLDMDINYKLFIHDLSQNPERAFSVRADGITRCLTPSGLPWSTINGSLIYGVQSLMLQALPVAAMTFTRESNKNLQDLAGNAMTSTIVGVTMLVSLMVAGRRIPPDWFKHPAIESSRSGSRIPLEDHAMQIFPVSAEAVEKDAKISRLQGLAARSRRLCACEGSDSIAKHMIYECRQCGHTACDSCKGNPKHDYVSKDDSCIGKRISPATFVTTLLRSVPLRLHLSFHTEEYFDALNDMISGGNDAMVNGSLSVLEQNPNLRWLIEESLGKELRYTRYRRSADWSFFFENASASLQLKLSNSAVQWLFYVKVPSDFPVDSPERSVFAEPIARMTPSNEYLLEGQWEMCMPVTYNFQVQISGKGPKVPSWRARIGLKDFQSEVVCSEISLRMMDDEHDDFSGVFKHLPDCGTANSELHVRLSPEGSAREFLFRDPSRIGPNSGDAFVLSMDRSKLNYGESRTVLARLEDVDGCNNAEDETTEPAVINADGDETLRKTVNSNLGNTSKWRPYKQGTDPQIVNCRSYGTWIHCNASLTSAYQPPILLSVAPKGFKPPIRMTSSKVCHRGCKAPTSIVIRGTLGALSTKISTTRIRSSASLPNAMIEPEARHLFERIHELPFTEGKRWRLLEQIDPQVQALCHSCNPVRPTIKYRSAIRNSTRFLEPFEATADTASYEDAVKRLPKACAVQYICDLQQNLHVQVLLNIMTLAHRAAGALPHDDLATLRLSWRISTSYVQTTDILKVAFRLKSNRNDAREAHEFEEVVGTRLRPDQERSHHWMLQQEREDVEPFREEEVIEYIEPQLKWRLEGRATRQRRIRGGVLADEVGYGKTALIYALIEKTLNMAKKSAQKQPSDVRISVKATLIITPSPLTRQWRTEFTKFLGDGDEYKVLQLTSHSMRSTSIGDIQEADVVIIPWTLLIHDSYLRRLGELAGLPPLPPKSSPRVLDTWLKGASVRLGQHVELLKAVDFGISNDRNDFKLALENETNKAEGDHTIQERYPSHRLKDRGRYLRRQAKLENQEKLLQEGKYQRASILGLDVDDVSEVRGVVLQMFSWYRIVIDEFTYLDTEQSLAVRSLASKCKWILSGTPPLDNFHEIKKMSNLLGLHLGVDSFAMNVMNEQYRKAIEKEMTDLETFELYQKHNTPEWHQRRNRLAKDFCKTYIRQNVPEADDLPIVEEIRAVTLDSVQRAYYLELQMALTGIEVQLPRRSFLFHDNDRLSRIRTAVLGSESNVEALLKHTSVFKLEKPFTEKGRPPPPIVYKSKSTESRATENTSNKNKAHDAPGKLTAGVALEPEDDAWSIVKTYRESDLDHLRAEIREYLKLANSLENFLGPGTLPERAGYFSRWKKVAQDANVNDYGDGNAKTELIKLIHEADTAISQASHHGRTVYDAASEPSSWKKAPPSDLLELRYQQLRRYKDALGVLAKEMTSCFRSLRYAEAVHTVQTAKDLSESASLMCTGCSGENLSTKLLARCGHIRCDKDVSTCEPHCLAGHQGQVVYNLQELGKSRQETAGEVRFGAKAKEIVTVIETARDAKEKVLVFAQFNGLINDIAEVFRAHGISFARLGNAPAKNDTTLDAFKEPYDQDNADSKQVLILNLADSSAAGHNLHVANHVIFVAPLHARNQYHYQSQYKQAIGRARRFGQRKVVHVYHFLALNTYDVNIHQDRSQGCKLVEDATRMFRLVKRSELTPAEAAQEWSVPGLQVAGEKCWRHGDM